MSDSKSPDVGKPMVQDEEHDEGRVAVITLDRPEARNAQNKQMTYELNDAFTREAFTDSVKCIVLAANGPHFSAGHDLKGPGKCEADPVWVAGSTMTAIFANSSENEGLVAMRSAMARLKSRKLFVG